MPDEDVVEKENEKKSLLTSSSKIEDVTTVVNDKEKLTKNNIPHEQKQNQQQKNDDKIKEISTKEAYFTTLNEWVKQANISQNAMSMFPWYLLNNYPQLFQNSITTANVATTATTTTAAAFGAPWYDGLVTPLIQQNLTTGNIPAIATPIAQQQNHQHQQHQQQQQQQQQNLPHVDAAVAAATANAAIGLRILSENAQTELIHNNGGYEYVIAPFWKRAIAEIIDVIILLIIKIIVTFMIVNIFDFDIGGIDFDRDVLRKAIDEDDITTFLSISMDFLAFSSDLLLLEVLTKIIVCFYEAIWATIFYGATPGKVVMNLRILYVEAVLPLQQPVPPQLILQGQRTAMRALLTPGTTPTFGRALLRALAKNMIMTLLFPMCFIMLFFKNNRTAYDVLTKTIVVENTADPDFRYR